MNDGLWGLVKVICYWGYVALTPGLIVAIVAAVWLIPREQ